MRDLIDRARHLTVEAEITDYAPDRVAVLEQRDSTSPPATTVWPGPRPTTFLHETTAAGRSAIACGAVTGAAARTVYTAARRNDGQRWLVDGVSRTLVVNPLPLGIAAESFETDDHRRWTTMTFPLRCSRRRLFGLTAASGLLLTGCAGPERGTGVTASIRRRWPGSPPRPAPPG